MNRRLIITAITLEGLLAGLAVTTLIQGKTFGALFIALLLQWPSSALLASVDGSDTVRGIAVCCLIFIIQAGLIWGVLCGLRWLFTKKEERSHGRPRLVYAPWAPIELRRQKEPNQAAQTTPGPRPSVSDL
jgi:hypothetical protein